MYLHSLATALPPHRYQQQDLWNAFCQSSWRQRLKPRSADILEKVLLGDNGIESRSFATPDMAQLFDLEATALNRYFERSAPELAERALRRALEQAYMNPVDLDALLVCTCTGYLCPGLTSYLSERLGLAADTYLQDLVGLGCGAAIPTLRSAHYLCAAQPGGTDQRLPLWRRSRRRHLQRATGRPHRPLAIW